MKPVLVGQTRIELEPVMGSAGRMLADLAGVDYPGEYRRTFTRETVMGRGRFSVEHARKIATRLSIRFAGRVVVMLGYNVARAFSRNSQEFLMPSPPVETSGGSFVKFPHPYRTSHWWSTQENLDRARFFLAELVQGRLHFSSHHVGFDPR